MKIIYALATKLETRQIQKWFGGGEHPFDSNRVYSRRFTYEELVGLHNPISPEYEDRRRDARQVLWNLWEKAGCPPMFIVDYYDE